MQRRRLGSLLLPVAAVVGLVGGGLALGATAGALSRAGVAHVAGLLLLPAALALAAVGIRLEGSRAGSDALLVFGGFWLHLFALAVAVLSGVWWLTGGGDDVGLAAVAWGVAAAAYALLGYGWDRATATDVDEVLADWRDAR